MGDVVEHQTEPNAVARESAAWLRTVLRRAWKQPKHPFIHCQERKIEHDHLDGEYSGFTLYASNKLSNLAIIPEKDFRLPQSVFFP